MLWSRNGSPPQGKRSHSPAVEEPTCVVLSWSGQGSSSARSVAGPVDLAKIGQVFGLNWFRGTLVRAGKYRGDE